MMRKASVLIVDDEIPNIEIMNALLEDDYDTSFATSGHEALETARILLPDLILLDVVMPGMDGFEVCRRLKEEPLLADVPVIFTTGLGDLADEARGLSLGAIDYVTKPVQPVTLRARVGNHIEMKRMRDQLAEMAVTDVLTGLSNRRRMEQALRTEVARLARTGDWMAVILLDIDFFKQFNDTYGHPAGDRCIAMIGSALSRAARRASDVPARYGGEEFACILPATDLTGALTVAREIESNVQALVIPHESSTVSSRVTISMGVAAARCEPGMTGEEWIAQADAQLYHSKSGGRNRITSTVFGGAVRGAG